MGNGFVKTMLANSLLNATTLPFIPDGNPPIESTNGNNTEPAVTNPGGSSAPVVTSPAGQGGELVVVTLPSDSSDSTQETNSSNTNTTSSDSDSTSASFSDGEIITVSTTVNTFSETIVNESSATTVLVVPDGTETTGLESYTYESANLETISSDSTNVSGIQRNSKTNIFLGVVAVILVFLIIGALVALSKLKKKS